MLCPMPLPDGVTIVDIRPAELRFHDPLENLTALPIRAVTLEHIEEGKHGLTPELGPLLVVCERGIRSGLAARFLRSDGLDARAFAGGVPALKREVEV